jgi:two-component system chemotaxis response regulator CheY
MRTIVIDYSPMARRVLRHHLTKIGCKVIAEAENAAEALKLFREHQPDLVTVDLMMPEVGGVDSREALRQMTVAKPDLIAIVVSAVPYDKVRERFLREGALAYIVKPLTPASFEPLRRKLSGLKQSAA